MPYIKNEDKICDHYALTDIVNNIRLKGPGFANYIISYILYKAYNIIDDNASYAKYNEALGVLSAVALEMSRRFEPYEIKKMEENGDIKNWI